MLFTRADHDSSSTSRALLANPYVRRRRRGAKNRLARALQTRILGSSARCNSDRTGRADVILRALWKVGMRPERVPHNTSTCWFTPNGASVVFVSRGPRPVTAWLCGAVRATRSHRSVVGGGPRRCGGTGAFWLSALNMRLGHASPLGATMLAFPRRALFVMCRSCARRGAVHSHSPIPSVRCAGGAP